MRNVLLFAVTGSFLLAGCTVEQGPNGQSASAEGGGDNDAYRFASQGQWTGEVERDTLECDDDGTLSMAAQGQGELTVSVTDDGGRQIGSWEFNGQGQSAKDERIEGAAGTWTVVVEAGSPLNPFSPGFQGQYAGSVTC